MVCFRRGARKGKEMALSETQTVGLGKRVNEVLLALVAVLATAGMDARVMAAEVDRLLKEFSAADSKQEALKRQLKAQTDVVEGVRHRLHVTASGYLDAAIAGVGKDSTAADNLRRMRSEIQREIAAGSGPSEPAPAATA